MILISEKETWLTDAIRYYKMNFVRSAQKMWIKDVKEIELEACYFIKKFFHYVE